MSKATSDSKKRMDQIAGSQGWVARKAPNRLWMPSAICLA
jgi:hypothetical protein